MLYTRYVCRIFSYYGISILFILYFQNGNFKIESILKYIKGILLFSILFIHYLHMKCNAICNAFAVGN